MSKQLTWDDNKMASGFDNIDSSHRFIVNSINIIQDAIRKNRSNEIIEKLFEALGEHINIHFKEEEEILKKSGRLSQSHINEHQDFKLQIKSLRKRFKSNKTQKASEIISEELLRYIIEWVKHHLFKTDLPALKNCSNERN